MNRRPNALLAAAFLAVLVLFASPAMAQKTPAAPEERPAPAEAAPAKKMGTIEQHIANLRQQLSITADLENEWKALAQAMRDNAATMKTCYDKWKTAAGNLTALENLKLHAEMTEAQAQALHKLVTAFTPLYNKMTDAQKKIADDVFSYRHAPKQKKAGQRNAPQPQE